MIHVRYLLFTLIRCPCRKHARIGHPRAKCESLQIVARGIYAVSVMLLITRMLQMIKITEKVGSPRTFR